MTTDSKLNGMTILWGAIIASFAAQFLPFQAGSGRTASLTNVIDRYGRAGDTRVILDLGSHGNGWAQHPSYWMLYAALAAAWLIPVVRTNDNWRTFGPWVTAATLFYCAGSSAPFQTSGGGLAVAAAFVAVWGAWRMRGARKAEELAAAEARKAAVSGEPS